MLRLYDYLPSGNGYKVCERLIPMPMAWERARRAAPYRDYRPMRRVRAALKPAPGTTPRAHCARKAASARAGSISP